MPSNDLEEAYRVLLDLARDAIVVVTRTEVISYANRPAEILFGYAPGELIGRPLECLVPERFRPGHRIRVRRFFETPAPRTLRATPDFMARRKDGSEFPIEVSLQPFITKHGTTASVAIRDLTARREVEAQLRKTRDLVRQLEREKADFLDNMSNELLNPLHAILGFARLLQRDKQDPLSDHHRIRATHIVESGEELLGFLEGLLDPQRSRVNHPENASEVMSVPVVLRELRHNFSLTTPGVTLTISAATGVLPMVAADRALYLQMLKSLTRAVLRRGAGPSLLLTMERVLPTWVRVSITSPEGATERSASGSETVQSLVPSMDPHERDALSSARQLAETMGGLLSLTTTPAGHVCGRLDMPVYESSSISPPRPSDPANDVAHRRRQVLYVESDPAMVRFLRTVARRVPEIVIQIASTADEANEIAADYPPDIVLVGIATDTDGVDALLPLRESLATKDVLVKRLDPSRTHHEREDDVIAALELRAAMQPVP